MLFQGRRKLFSIGGAESEGRRPEKIFKFRVSEMPFPVFSVTFVTFYYYIFVTFYAIFQSIYSVVLVERCNIIQVEFQAQCVPFFVRFDCFDTVFSIG
jgi:hypothetical protein